MTNEQRAACDAYWTAETREAERDALAEMKRLGLRYGEYTGADSEMVQWSDDDGSAANEPELRSDTPTMTEQWRQEAVERLANQAEQIGALMCRNNQLERENAALREANQSRVDLLLENRALRESRDYWQALRTQQASPSSADYWQGRAFPLNAIKHSR